MQIYVVKSGDTLYDISQDYDVSIELLVDANAIRQPDNLVVGQTIVIPLWGSYYFVEKGDTLSIISKKTGVSEEQLIGLNEFANLDILEVGTRIYLPQEPRQVMDVTAYVDLKVTGESTITEMKKAAEQLTFINVFSYEIKPDGTLNQIIDEDVIQTAYGNIISPNIVITNLDEGKYSQELVTTILSSEALQNNLLQESLSIMEEKGYEGIEFNLQHLGPQNRERYHEFLRKAVALFSPMGYTVSTAVIPNYFKELEGTLYDDHDYETLGQIVDYINFKTYDWYWSVGPPRPVAPINVVRQIMEYVISVVPNDKIIMGIPLYGYNWTLTYESRDQFVRLISPQKVIEMAQQYGLEIEYDEKSESPYFAYIDRNGVSHIVWFEDARSVQAKFELAKELELKGLNFWLLGFDFPQNWLLVDDNFIVRKKV
jgi:spore germination protein